PAQPHEEAAGAGRVAAARRRGPDHRWDQRQGEAPRRRRRRAPDRARGAAGQPPGGRQPPRPRTRGHRHLSSTGYCGIRQRRASTGRVDDFASLIRDIPDFPEPGVVFKDITPILGHADTFARLVSAMADPFRDKGVTQVAGIEARGFTLAAPIALELNAGFIPIRKPGKLPFKTVGEEYTLEYGTDRLEIHVDAAGPSDRVLLVDDVIATGGTAAAALRLVQQTGAEVVGFSVFIELAFLNGKGTLPEVPYHALLVYDGSRSGSGDVRRRRRSVPRPPSRRGCRSAPSCLRARRPGPRRPGAQDRPPLHHPPAGGGVAPGPLRPRRGDDRRRPAPRHRGGHRCHPGAPRRRVRRRDRRPHRRRHQARPDRLLLG